MSYCTVLEVRQMLKDDTLNLLIGNEYIESKEEQEKYLVPIIEKAIADADAEIDGYLMSRYPLPFQTVPRVINKFSKDIALYNVFSRIGIDEGERENNYLLRYRAAVKFLENVGKGIINIGVDIKQTAASGFTLKSNERIFSRNSMKGM